MPSLGQVGEIRQVKTIRVTMCISSNGRSHLRSHVVEKIIFLDKPICQTEPHVGPLHSAPIHEEWEGESW